MNENENDLLENEENDAPQDNQNEENSVEGENDIQQNSDVNSDNTESIVLTAEQVQTLVNGSLFQSFTLATILGVLAFSLFAKGVNN